MMRDIYLLGSTGSIGLSTLNIVRNNKKKFIIKLLSTNKNIKVFFNIEDAFKGQKKKVFLTINAISGIDGLEPTIKIIKFTKNLAIANKESIICGWKFIKKTLIRNNTNFIPLDSEHFSIWSILKNEDKKNIRKIYLTASGGPFLNKKLKNIKYIEPKFALKHPNWRMGKKITIDSATMMNKIFEIIEAVKIFELDIKKFEILIHPKSYIHALVTFNNGLTKLLAHDTTMEIPISNAMNLNNRNFTLKFKPFDYQKLNGKTFIKPDIINFPLLKILNNKFNNTYFETILVSLNDELVRRYLNNKIPYISIHKTMLELLKKKYFSKYYNKSPRNIYEIKLMVKRVNQYLENYT